MPTLPQVGHGGCVVGFAAGEVPHSDLIGGRSIELARDYQYLARSAERMGLSRGALDRLRPITDEVPVRSAPYLTGPAAAA